ncbi:protein of unknown function [Ekhidna lutea]|uniref:DUF4920 domain-containing protein n=1 Tax=Ekhidna lutea TaxID=447679 RepID=A0A239HTS8_EKHLU|nr:DUF4920 domain-containing protein [Ekhidna lutea]SNS83624.1 protein of unknown function [Ekhidna lutea]
MRFIIILLVAIACAAPSEKFSSHGDEISAENAISTDEFLGMVGEEKKSFKVQGTIEEVCQMKGCWMTLKNESGENIRITFKDYGFFVPKDVNGREVVIEGEASKEILDEDVARHYAEDGGKEYDESMRKTISFVAKGVLIKES